MSCDETSQLGDLVYFQRGNNASPETFRTLGTVTGDLGSLSRSADTVPSNRRGPGHQGYKQFRKTMKDGGELTYTIESLPGHEDWDDLESDFENDICARNYRLIYPNGVKQNVPAICVGFEQTHASGELITAKIKLKVSGRPTRV